MSDKNTDWSKKREKRPSKRTMYPPTDWYQYNPVSEFSAGHWSSQGQRLYPTMSDSAVYNYPLPYDYSVNGIPGYSTYSPIFPASMLSANVDRGHRPSRIHKRNHNLFRDVSECGNANTVFASLPPVNFGDMSCNEKRRFSDPGLNNVDESNEHSSESISDSCSCNNEFLLDQISELKSENKRLNKELESTKAELKSLKSELVIINKMIKEIRDAAELREKLLISKIDSVISKSVDKSMVDDSRDLDKRINLLEKEFKSLQLRSNAKVNGEATISELNNSTKQKFDPTDPSSKLRSIEFLEEVQLHPTLRMRLNGDTGDSASDCNGNSLSTISYESLSSSVGPGSMSSVTYTLCGPVTDL